MKRSLVFAAAAALSFGLAADVQAEEISCSSYGGNLTGSLTEKLIVDTNCRIDDAVVRGNVSFAGPYVLTISNSEVRGNIDCNHGGSLELSYTMVTGNLDGCGGGGYWPAHGRKKQKGFRAELSGFEEVPAISTSGSGSFSAWVDKKEPVLRYRLSYDDLQGDVLFAHIHFGRTGTNGGVIVFLCSNEPPPVGVETPTCPAPGQTLEGALDPSDVVGPEDQGIAPGEADEALAALRAGAGYVNVHTSEFPGGEIRGQIEQGRPPRRR